jgi:hypothetical protein
METRSQSQTELALSAFLPVTVRVLDSSAGQQSPIEADLPNGIRLRIPTAIARLACRLVHDVARAKTSCRW